MIETETSCGLNDVLLERERRKANGMSFSSRKNQRKCQLTNNFKQTVHNTVNAKRKPREDMKRTRRIRVIWSSE